AGGWRGAGGAGLGGPCLGATRLGGAGPGEAGDVADNRIGADGGAAEGVNRAAVLAGEVVDEVEDERRDEVDALGVERDALEVEEHLRALARSEDEVAAQDALLLDESLEPAAYILHTPSPKRPAAVALPRALL